tara:strand:- start:36 stop:1055 length:1020 start_codon:yes stop_codon:yes gene_type:complete
MNHATNRQILLASRPVGAAKLTDFELVETNIPPLREGEVLFRNTLISIDPYQRNLMGNGSSELPPVDLDTPMQGPTVAVVIESRNPDFAVGEHIQTWSGWQEFSISDGSDLRKLNADGAPLSTALGVLGHTGITAWFGATKVHDLKPGSTVIVTGAAGSVGSMAAQLLKLRGHRVVGVAGGAEKVAYLKKELGLDEAIDYKAADFETQLKRALPAGIDMLFDNVGGSVFPVLMEYFNPYAKMVVCGTIADYSNTNLPQGTNYLPRLITLIHYRFIDIKAFSIPNHLDRYPEFLAEVTPLVTDGSISYNEDFVDGFENIPQAFLGLFEGLNRGKLIARVG